MIFRGVPGINTAIIGAVRKRPLGVADSNLCMKACYNVPTALQDEAQGGQLVLRVGLAYVCNECSVACGTCKHGLVQTPRSRVSALLLNLTRVSARGGGGGVLGWVKGRTLGWAQRAQNSVGEDCQPPPLNKAVGDHECICESHILHHTCCAASLKPHCTRHTSVHGPYEPSAIASYPVHTVRPHSVPCDLCRE